MKTQEGSLAIFLFMQSVITTKLDITRELSEMQTEIPEHSIIQLKKRLSLIEQHKF